MPFTDEMNAMSKRLIATAALAATTLLLCSCGFVTAPLGYAGAYAGKGTIKAADKGIEYGKQAAAVVVNTTIQASEAAAQGMQRDPDAPAPSGSLRHR